MDEWVMKCQTEDCHSHIGKAMLVSLNRAEDLYLTPTMLSVQLKPNL